MKGRRQIQFTKPELSSQVSKLLEDIVENYNFVHTNNTFFLFVCIDHLLLFVKIINNFTNRFCNFLVDTKHTSRQLKTYLDKITCSIN